MSTTEGTPPRAPYAGDFVPPPQQQPIPAPPANEAPRTSGRARVLMFAEAYAVPVLFIAVLIFFSTWGKTRKTFLTVQNFQNVLGNQAVVGILALAIIIPLVCGEFDFSVGPIMGLTQMACAGFMANQGFPLPIAILGGVLIGTLIGLSTGNVVARVGVNSLIVTLGLATTLLGVVQLIWPQAIIQGLDKGFTSLGSKQLLGIPAVAYFLLAVALLVWYLLEHTPYGRYLHGIGSNREAARLVGLPVAKYVLLAFVISGTLAGVAGVLLLGRSGSANPLQDGGVTQTLQALAAAFLGTTCIKPGRFNVLGTLVAIFFLAFTVQGLVLAGVSNWIYNVFNGAALFVAVLISTIVGRKRAEMG
jgi:ribose transport system permease protein